jgi:hypothetical protein
MKNINRVIIYAPGSSHAYIQQNYQDITTRISKQKRINYKWISLLQLNQESVQGMWKRKRNTWKVGRHRDVNWETTPRNRWAHWCSSPRRRVLSSSRRYPRENRRIEKASVSTQLVLNKYNTNYEALRLADSTALAFRLDKILLKLITTSGWLKLITTSGWITINLNCIRN